jgi:hypothetical protein
MKHIATAALMLNLGVAGVYAQQNVKVTFSGTGGSSTINLQQPNTKNSVEAVGDEMKVTLEGTDSTGKKVHAEWTCSTDSNLDLTRRTLWQE